VRKVLTRRGDPEQPGADVGPDQTGRDPAPPDQTAAHSDTLLKNMFGKDMLYLAGTVLPLVLTAAIIPIVTRTLGARQFGISQLGLTISQVLWWLFGLGLQTAVQREFERPNGLHHAKNLIGFSCIVVTAFTGVAVWTAPTWATLIGAPHFVLAMRLSAIWGGTGAITFVGLSLLRSTERIRPYLIAALLQSVVAQSIGLAATITVKHTAAAYLTGVVIGQVLALGVVLITVKPSFSMVFNFSLLRPTLGFSLPLVPQQLSAYILWAGDRIVVQRDLGSAATGRYAVAYAVGSIGMTVLGQLNQTWLPRVFSMKDVRQRGLVLHRLFIQLTAVLYPTLLALCFLAPALLLIAAPANYRPLSLVFVVTLIVPSAIPQSAYHANMRVLLAHDRTAALALATTGCAVLNLLLNVLLVPSLGINGSAVATLAAYVVLALVAHALARREPDRLSVGAATIAMYFVVGGACLAIGLLPWNFYGAILRCILGVVSLSVCAQRVVRFAKS
jgi:O-antigen/teichoic acid export membrane protein